MTITTFEKSDFNWYGISIIPNNKTVDIFLLFKDLNDAEFFFNLITRHNKQPSFYCILQPNNTHILKIDYSSDLSTDDYISVACIYTITDYPSLNLLKEHHNFKIIIGTEKITDEQVKTMGTNMTFIPKAVEYLSSSEQYKPHIENLN